MKRITLIFTLLIAITWIACDDDTTPVAHELDGNWYLVSISCLCEPININGGESTWTFDVANNLMTVQNSIPVQGPMLASDSYMIDVDDTNTTISMEDFFLELCNYQFQDNNQTLYIGCSTPIDGPLYTLIRGTM